MYKLKTRPTTAHVAAFLESVADSKRRDDCDQVAGLMQEISGEDPVMWGSSIIGFGSYHYKYASGHEGDYFITGVSPRKQALTIYIMDGFGDHTELMGKLGKYKTGKSCLYVKKLEDIDLKALSRIIEQSVETMRSRYPATPIESHTKSD